MLKCIILFLQGRLTFHVLLQKLLGVSISILVVHTTAFTSYTFVFLTYGATLNICALCITHRVYDTNL